MPVRRVEHEHAHAAAGGGELGEQPDAQRGLEVLEAGVRERGDVVLRQPARDVVLARGPVCEGELLADDDPQLDVFVGVAHAGGVDDRDELGQPGVHALGVHRAGGRLQPPGQREAERGDADAGFAVHDRQIALADGQRGGR